MKNFRLLIVIFILFAWPVTLLHAQEPIVFPAKGQSEKKMDQDKYTCYNWAKKQTGFDPMQVPTTSTPPPEKKASQGGAVKGAAAGALIGVAAGAAGGDAGKGAAVGAAAGGVAGGLRAGRCPAAAHPVPVDVHGFTGRLVREFRLAHDRLDRGFVLSGRDELVQQPTESPCHGLLVISFRQPVFRQIHEPVDDPLRSRNGPLEMFGRLGFDLF